MAKVMVQRIAVTASHPRKWFRLRGQAQDKTTWIALGGAVVALGLMVYMFTARNANGAGSYDDLHLQCTACGHQFTMTAQAAAEERAKAGQSRKPLTCPKCHKEAGATMIKCGKCGEYYLPKSKGEPDWLKCPHCGFNPGK